MPSRVMTGGVQARVSCSSSTTGGQASRRRESEDDEAGYGGQAKSRIGIDKVRVNVKSRCTICSRKRILGYKTRNYYHQHFSSKYYQRFSRASNTREAYCPTCKRAHRSRRQSRVKIVVSSFLHEFWAPRGRNINYEGDAEHIEYITIPSARINELTTAWEVEYINDPRPLDVLFVGGVENVVKGAKTESIMRAFKHFVDLVTWQGRFHPNKPNTCGIATLSYPPKLCKLDGETGMMGARNKYAEMRQLNKEIEVLNAESGLKVPNFTTLGLRQDRAKTKHRLQQWQGTTPEEMLYLKDELLVKMGKQIGKYFKHETDQ